jgi:hypothetical protein
MLQAEIARLAEQLREQGRLKNLSIELFSWRVQRPPDHPARILHALDANGQVRRQLEW